jgi:hypothetical protein
VKKKIKKLEAFVGKGRRRRKAPTRASAKKEYSREAELPVFSEATGDEGDILNLIIAGIAAQD